MIGLFAGVFGLFIADAAQKYGQLPESGNASLAAFDQINEVNALAKEIRDTEEGTTPRTGFTDFIEDYFRSGYAAARIVKQSTAVGDAMIEDATSQTNLGETGILFKQVAMTAILILIFLGVIVAILVKRDM